MDKGMGFQESILDSGSVERNCYDPPNLEGRSTQEEKSSQTKENLKYDDFLSEKREKSHREPRKT